MNWSDYNIEIPYGKRSGEVKTFCPQCKDTRRNKRDKPLSVNLDKRTFYCHHCEYTGYLKEAETKMENKKETYKRPVWKNETQLSDRAAQYFESRGIGQDWVRHMKITDGETFMPQENKKRNAIWFPYFLNGELINIKYRTADKLFRLEAGAQLIPWNLDAIKGKTECIITEGEFDCLSFMAAGFQQVISVPNGASSNTSYLDDFWEEYFEDKEVVYIAVDTDCKGHELRDELVRRFGAERCKIVTYGDECKDANELVMKKNIFHLQDAMKNAAEVKVEGVFTVPDFEDELDFLYQNGLQKGVQIGLWNFDALCSFETKRLCVVTGIPGHGKSEFTDEMVERLNVLHGWKAAYFSPENVPLKYHASKLISKLTGKTFDAHHLTTEEYRQVKNYLSKEFFFILPEEGYSVETILEKAHYLVRRKGIKVLVVDPWNRLEHQVPHGISETNYISRELDRFSNFAQRHDVLVVIVAHPKKMERKNSGEFATPTLYDINGSANFYNKADYGLTVYRNRGRGCIEVHVQKVKFRHLGESGIATFQYNLKNGRYVPYEEDRLLHWDNSSHLANQLEKYL